MKNLANRSILITSLVCGFLGLLGTILNTNQFEAYGTATFVMTPFIAGILPAILLNWRSNAPLKASLTAGSMSIFIAYLLLLLFAYEGAICLLMSIPIALLAQLLGGLIGHLVIRRIRKPRTLVLSLLLLHPLYSWVEHQLPEHSAVRSPSYEMVIDAPLDVVWQAIESKNQFERPSHLLLRAGVAHPKSTELIYSDQGDYFDCQYSGGQIGLRIDSLVPRQYIRFGMHDTPEPMKELSFYNEVHAPHLHGSFRVLNGEFHLKKINENSTLISATTHYQHFIRPGIYWHLWSDYLLNQVHKIVLDHVKKQAE